MVMNRLKGILNLAGSKLERSLVLPPTIIALFFFRSAVSVPVPRDLTPSGCPLSARRTPKSHGPEKPDPVAPHRGRY